jgi:hypothetical protein
MDYRVSLKENQGDKFTIIVDIVADSADDACYIAEELYPHSEIINATQFTD